MLTLAEIAALPLRAALFDEAGNEVARTPEWAGAGASAVAYRHEGYRLVVASAAGAAPPAAVAEALVAELIAALEDAAAAVEETARRRLAVLTEGVRVAAGRVAAGSGTSADVAACLRACAPVRSEVSLGIAGGGRHPVPAPAAVAAALLQIVINAEVHAGARAVDLRVLAAHGTLTFRLQWAGTAAGALPVSSRAQRRAVRTGLAAARIIADAVGADLTALLAGIDPRTGRTDRALTRVELALPATDLALPLARVDGSRVGWCTRTFGEETGLRCGDEATGDVARLVDLARLRPASVVGHGDLSARSDGATTWVAQPPDDPADRCILAARLVEHERALATAPPAHRARVEALAAIVLHVLGEALPTVSGDTWSARIGTALSAYGLTMSVPVVDAERVIAAPVCAYLMSECGGVLLQDGDELTLTVPKGMHEHPLVRLLSADGERILLTP